MNFRLLICGLGWFSVALTGATAKAQSDSPGISLDGYKCEQFLADAEHPGDAAKLLRTMIAISWAAGYTAAYEAKGPRGDTQALELTGAALGNICRTHKADPIVTAFAAAVKDAVDHPPPGDHKQHASVVDTRFIKYGHTDLPGNDLTVIKGTTLDACATACSDNSECEAYSYDRWNKFCIEKREISSLTLNAKSITGIRERFPKPSTATTPITMERYRRKSFRDEPTRKLSQSSVAVCEKACMEAETCIAYTFMDKISECYIFDDTSEYFPNENAVSGIKVQRP